MAHSLPDFPKFEINRDSTTTGHRWTKNISKLENVFVSMNIDRQKSKKSIPSSLCWRLSLRDLRYARQRMK